MPGRAACRASSMRHYVLLDLQAVRIREIEAELEARYGPITEEAEQRVAALEWPR